MEYLINGMLNSKQNINVPVVVELPDLGTETGNILKSTVSVLCCNIFSKK